MEFFFQHPPKAQKRPRFGCGVVYDPQKKIKELYQIEAVAQMRRQGSEMVLESPVSVNLSIEVPLPNSWSHKRKEREFGKSVTTRPDLDNYLKFYLDVLNGIAYEDDKLVSEIFCHKLYGDEGSVRIEVNKSGSFLKDEISMLGKMAVDMHASLDHLYQWSKDLKDTFPNKKEIEKVASYVKERCLEGGLFEIYNDFGPFPEKNGKIA